MKFNYSWKINLDQENKRKIRELFIASINDNGMLGFDKSNENDIDEFISKLSAKIKNNISHLLLIVEEKSNKPAGVVVFTQIQHKTSKHIAELSKVIINPSFRGTEVLKKGLMEVCKFSEINDVSRLIFDVRDGTNSSKLWSAIGFDIYGKLDDYSHYQDETYAGLFMTAAVKDLKSRYKEYL